MVIIYTSNINMIVRIYLSPKKILCDIKLGKLKK